MYNIENQFQKSKLKVDFFFLSSAENLCTKLSDIFACGFNHVCTMSNWFIDGHLTFFIIII